MTSSGKRLAWRGASASAVAAALTVSLLTGGVALAQDASPAAGETPVAGGTLQIGSQAQPPTMDPHKTSSTGTRNVTELIYDTLVALDPNDQVVPSLATDWTVSDDSLTYTFELRDDVVFHSGDQLTAHDVVFSYERIMDPETASPQAGRFASVESITALDDDTVEIRLSEPYAPLLANLAFSLNSIMSSDVVTEGVDPAETVIGTGPFVFEGFVPDQTLVLTRNPDYWVPGLPYLDRLEWSYFPDAVALVNALKTAAIDWTGVIPDIEIAGLEAEGFHVVGGLGTNWRGLMFNTRVPPFDDPQVRRAVSTALGRNDIVTLSFPSGSGGVPIIGSPILPDHWAYGGTFGMTGEADPEAAREMLAEAGYPDGIDAVMSVYTNFPFLRLPAEPIQAQLAEAGVRVDLRLIEGTAFAESLQEGDYQVALYGNSGLTDPDDWFTGPLHSESANNVTGWADPTADALMERGRTTIDQDERKEIYDELTAYVIEQSPIAWIYHTTQFEGFAPDVKGFEHWANTSHLGLVTTWLDR